MAKFKLISRDFHAREEKKEIEAWRFEDQGTYTVFIGENGEQLHALRTEAVQSIERLAEAK